MRFSLIGGRRRKSIYSLVDSSFEILVDFGAISS